MTKQHGGAIVDLGNVIIAHWLSNTTPENFHTIDYNSIPEVPGSLEGLWRLSQKFGGNVTVVYKATDTATEKIVNWLAYHKFTERTGISMNRIHRIGLDRYEKANYIEQTSDTHYGTTVVVDDRLEVLSHFVGKVPHLFLFHCYAPEVAQFRHTGALDHVLGVETWQELERVFDRM